MRTGDFIFVKNLLVKSVAGVDGWQRSIAQPLKIGIAINAAGRLKRMGLTDDIRRTLNYDLLSTAVVEQLEAQKSTSSEEAALETLKLIQNQINPGEVAEVSVDQPKALLLAKSHRVKLNATKSAVEDIVTESIEGMDLHCLIGINELELVNRQLVKVDIDVKRPRNSPIFTSEFVAEIGDFLLQNKYLTVESFVNSIAQFVCQQQFVEEATVRAAKPNALSMADEAAVQVTRRLKDYMFLDNAVYIAFGTNQGDRVANVRRSIVELEARGITVERSSSIYESNPMYFTDQPKFLNGVFKCRTSLAPLELLAALKDIEYEALGRVKLFDNGPRTLDLDIILYGNELVELDSLTVPHRDMLNRSFVLRPLNELLTSSQQFETISDGERTIVPLNRQDKYLEFDVGFTKKSVPTQVMAIMNATPDSFSDGGDLTSSSTISDIALQHIRDGATILDIGGYSTRPGAAVVPEDEEIRRVCETVRAIREVNKEVVISVDTFRGPVARAAIDTGADIINDVFSGAMDSSIFTVAAETGAPIILSHARGSPESMTTLTDYPNGVITGVATELRERIDAALAAGCQTWQLILDPGLGFAKTKEQDLELVRDFSQLIHAPEITDGLPILPWLVGPSRKSFIGHFTGVTEPKDRVPGGLAVVTALRQQGADIVRVHDTKATAQALKMVDIIYNNRLMH